MIASPAPIYARVPLELRNLPQWVVWKHEPNENDPTKLDKIPYQSRDVSRRARPNDPTTWASFDMAVIMAQKHRLPGPGFVFRESGGLVGLDFDDCIDEKGNTERWASEWIEKFATYTEISPSGRGVKLWLRGTKPRSTSELKVPAAPVHTPEHPPGIEIYDHGRFFCVTGKAIDGHTSIAARQDILESLYHRFSNGNGHIPAGEGVGEGQRHQALLSLARSLRARGLSREEILTSLRGFNEQHCKPPKVDSELVQLANYVAAKPAGFPGQRAVETSAEVELQSFRDVAAESVSWLWLDRVAFGKLNLFVGEPGEGKSLATVDIAARLSRGTGFPDGAPCQLGDSIILSAEDGEADTIRPRLDAANADVSRIFRVKAVKVTLAGGETAESTFNLERDVEKLDEKIAKNPFLRLLIIDPLSAYMGRVDTWKDGETRRILTPLAELANRRRVAVMGIMHLKKSEASALLRVSGSIAFVAAARIIWGFGKHPDDPEMRVMVPVKNNLAALGEGLAYRIAAKGTVPFIAWENGSIAVDANDVLASDQHRDRKLGSSLAEAKDWLADALNNGPRAVKELERQAKQDGLSWTTIERARYRLKIRAYKISIAGGWAWEIQKASRARGGDA